MSPNSGPPLTQESFITTPLQFWDMDVPSLANTGMTQQNGTKKGGEEAKTSPAYRTELLPQGKLLGAAHYRTEMEFPGGWGAKG